jgi:hypothetical protein
MEAGLPEKLCRDYKDEANSCYMLRSESLNSEPITLND